MKRTDKETFITEFQERLGSAPVVYLTDFTGLDVKSITKLRAQLRAAGAEYYVVKNRLMKRALEGLDFPDLEESLRGPTGVVIGLEDIVQPAKALTDFAKEHDDRPAFKIGVLENQLFDLEQMKKLAKLPSREELLAQLAGAFEAPMQALAGALQAKIQELMGLFDSLREQKEEG